MVHVLAPAVIHFACSPQTGWQNVGGKYVLLNIHKRQIRIPHWLPLMQHLGDFRIIYSVWL